MVPVHRFGIFIISILYRYLKSIGTRTCVGQSPSKILHMTIIVDSGGETRFLPLGGNAPLAPEGPLAPSTLSATWDLSLVFPCFLHNLLAPV